MVRLRDGFVSGLPLITLPDRQFDRPISDGPPMAWASNNACTEAGWQCRSPGPNPYLLAGKVKAINDVRHKLMCFSSSAGSLGGPPLRYKMSRWCRFKRVLVEPEAT